MTSWSSWEMPVWMFRGATMDNGEDVMVRCLGVVREEGLKAWAVVARARMAREESFMVQVYVQ